MKEEEEERLHAQDEVSQQQDFHVPSTAQLGHHRTISRKNDDCSTKTGIFSETDTHRERHIQRQTQTHAETDTYRNRDRQTDRHIQRQTQTEKMRTARGTFSTIQSEVHLLTITESTSQSEMDLLTATDCTGQSEMDLLTTTDCTGQSEMDPLTTTDSTVQSYTIIIQWTLPLQDQQVRDRLS